MNTEDLVGKIVIDNGRLGVIINEVLYTVITEETVWTRTYEIKYVDGGISMINAKNLEALIERGRIVILDKKQ